MTITTTSPIPRWAFHRRLYNWVVSFAHSKHAAIALFFLSAIEACIFPIAPDVLLLVLAVERPNRAWFYAWITTSASVIGGLIGYCVGAAVWQWVSGYFFQYLFNESTFLQVQQLYQRWDFWAVFVGAFTPIPYKVFTITAGVFKVSLVPFIVASIIGRGARFFLVAALIRCFGPQVKLLIDRYFNLLTIVFIALLAGGFLMLNYL